MHKNERWFLYPEDSGTNKTIAGRLDEHSSAFHFLICSDGESRGLWQCDREFVDRMHMDKLNFGLKFKVFVDRGNGIREYRKLFPASSFKRLLAS